MADNSSLHSATGLAHFDLSTVFRCAVDLAEVAAALSETECADVPTDNETTTLAELADFERHLDVSRRLGRIGEEAERLKRALGATGALKSHSNETEDGPKWDSFDKRFNNTSHDRGIRLALLKLATAAIDLSGFATWRDWQWHMRETGLRLLTWGLAQLWEGMSAEEQQSVRVRLHRTHKAIGWPADPTSIPPAYDGPEEVPLEDQYRTINNYISCYRSYLNDMQKAVINTHEQRQTNALRHATLDQFIEVGERVTQAIEALEKSQYSTATKWSDWYEKAFWPLVGLQRANEILPYDTWPADALEQRKIVACEAAILLDHVGATHEAKARLNQADFDEALERFKTAITKLRGASAAPAIAVGQVPTRRAKQRAKRREIRDKLVAALTLHHRYADGGCLNLEPVGNNDLAKLAKVQKSSASRFFTKEFKGYDKYTLCCRGPGKLAAELKLLNGEYSPHHLYGNNPPEKLDRTRDDDE